jgi:hypothetical protein
MRSLRRSDRDRSQNCAAGGYLLIEALVALSIFLIIFVPLLQALYSGLSISQKYIQDMRDRRDIKSALLDEVASGSTPFGAESSSTIVYTPVSNYSWYKVAAIGNSEEELFEADAAGQFGSEYCTIPTIPADREQGGEFVVEQGRIGLGTSSVATDIWPRNDSVFISADSNVQTEPDFYIVDVKDAQNIKIISSLNTGPGIKAIAVAGRYVYAANMSTQNELQVIDIHDPLHPAIISQLKVPMVGTSTPPIGVSVYFHRGYVYLGTTKSQAKELHIIDVRDPYMPRYLAGIETNTQVNALVVKDTPAGQILYAATPTSNQLWTIDIRVPTNPIVLGTMNFSGSSVQDGRRLYISKDELFLGRTVGGFNNADNHELFHFSLASQASTSSTTASATPLLIQSADIGSTINGIVGRDGAVFLATTDTAKEFQLWSTSRNVISASIDLPYKAIALRCSNDRLYVGLEGYDPLRILQFK